jgi:hypothetical protein
VGVSCGPPSSSKQVMRAMELLVMGLGKPLGFTEKQVMGPLLTHKPIPSHTHKSFKQLLHHVHLRTAIEHQAPDRPRRQDTEAPWRIRTSTSMAEAHVGADHCTHCPPGGARAWAAFVHQWLVGMRMSTALERTGRAIGRPRWQRAQFVAFNRARTLTRSVCYF